MVSFLLWDETVDEMVDAKRTLTAAFVKNVRHSGHYGPDKYGNQHGLILRVLPSGSKQWIWRGTVRGKRCDIGLGGFPYVTLAEARQAAFDNRKLARAGGDPLALKAPDYHSDPRASRLDSNRQLHPQLA